MPCEFSSIWIYEYSNTSKIIRIIRIQIRIQIITNIQISKCRSTNSDQHYKHFMCFGWIFKRRFITIRLSGNYIIRLGCWYPLFFSYLSYLYFNKYYYYRLRGFKEFYCSCGRIYRVPTGCTSCQTLMICPALLIWLQQKMRSGR